MSEEDSYLRAKTEKMRKKQETAPAKRRGRKPAFADVVLADSTPNDVNVKSVTALSYPKGVRVMIPQGMLSAEELMVYVKAYGE